MKAGLVALFTAESTISSLVGSRVYVGTAPQSAVLPHILITQMTSNEFNSFDATGDLRAVTFDIDCKADRAIEASNLADAVRDFIKDYSGTAGSETIRAVILNDESDGVESPSDNSDISTYVVTLDIDVHYNP